MGGTGVFFVVKFLITNSISFNICGVPWVICFFLSELQSDQKVVSFIEGCQLFVFIDFPLFLSFVSLLRYFPVCVYFHFNLLSSFI